MQKVKRMKIIRKIKRSQGDNDYNNKLAFQVLLYSS